MSERPEDDTAIKCPRCKKLFVAGAPDEDDDDDADDDRPVRKKKKSQKKGPMKVPVAAVVGVGVGVLAIVAVVVIVLLGERKPVAREEEPPPNLPAIQPVAPSQLRTMVTELFQAPAGQPVAANFLPSLETEAAEPAVPAFSTLKPREAAPKGGKAPDPTKVVEEASKSTVYIKLVQGRNPVSSGSGFVIRAEGTTALVATNYHVIRMAKEAPEGALRVVVVFDSGVPATEQEATATVVAHDEKADLAILRVPGVKRMPPVLDPLAAPTPTTTMQVHMLGFPFGVFEAAERGANPNISVGSGSVSSLKMTRSGEIDQVQIDGVLNKGNSGGPIVERATGRLVGIAVSIRDIGIGPGLSYAVPVHKLVALLDGRVQPPTFTGSGIEGGQAAFTVEVPVHDPLRRVKAVTLYLNPAGTAPAGVKDAATGWKPMAGAQKVDLTYDPGKAATGQIRLPLAGKTAEVGVQVACTASDGITAVSQPVTYTLNRDGVQAAGQSIPLGNLNRSPEKFTGQTVVVRGKMIPSPTPVWDVFELNVVNDNDAAPINLQFLTGQEVASQLKELPNVPVHLPVQLTCQVGKGVPGGKTLLRVTRVDLLGKGNKVALTIPSDTLEKADPLIALNRYPDKYVGQTLTLSALLTTNTLERGPNEIDLVVLLPTHKQPENVVFQTTRGIAAQLADDGPSDEFEATLTVKVEDRKLGNGRRVVTVAKIEFTAGGKKVTIE
jgi:S1-C subfamily serine protease